MFKNSNREIQRHATHVFIVIYVMVHALMTLVVASYLRRFNPRHRDIRHRDSRHDDSRHRVITCHPRRDREAATR